MNLPLPKIRFIQLKRQLKSLGLVYGLLVLLLLPLLLYVLHQKYQEPRQALYIAGFIGLAVLLIQVSRSDKAFVFNQLPQPRLNLFAEYTAFTLLFTFPVLLSPNWYLFPVLLLWFFLITLVKPAFKKTAVLPRFLKLIPAGNFEWKSGLRSSYFLVLLLPVLALGFSWLKFVPLLLLWLFTTIISGFYQECEPLHMLYATGNNAKDVVHHKLKEHNKLLLLFLLPPLVVSTIFHPQLWWVHALFLLLQLCLLSCAILLKYTTYEPNLRLRGNTVLLAIAALGALIPVMLPIPLLINLRNYGKAQQNLNVYFHDQDR